MTGFVAEHRDAYGVEQVELARLDWVHWYNHKRLLGPIGHVPPAEAEAACHRQQADQAKAA